MSAHLILISLTVASVGERNNIELGRYGRNRTNVWEYPGVNTLSKQGDEGNLLALHPTVKPVALIADALPLFGSWRSGAGWIPALRIHTHGSRADGALLLRD
jgi:hypothetical protein